MKVEVVANNQGIRMLQQGISPVAYRIRELNARYINLGFAACGNTMEKVAKKSGSMPVLIDGVKVVPAGVQRIMELQEQGYAYIRP